MYLHGLATANPPHSYTQHECWEAARSDPAVIDRLDRRGRLLLSTILRGDSGVETRQFAAPDIARVFSLDADALNGAFRAAAPRLAADALAPALARAAVDPACLDALVVCTCTGYLCPGLSSYVAEIMGLREDAWLQDLAGLGCGAAIPALRATEAMLSVRPSATVACVAVEVCSAAFYLDNDPGVIVSACLFGDGAAATVWRGSPGPLNLRCGDFDTFHAPSDRDRIRFEQRDGKLRNLLHPSVPQLAAGAVARLHRRAAASGIPPHRIIAHAGGRDVVNALEAALPGHRLEASRRILRRHGNMSSPSVLFALEEALRDDAPSPNRDWWLVSFGAGFSAHSCRLSAA